MSFKTHFCTVACAAVAAVFAASAGAATVNEWSQPGGDFSDVWTSPTVIAAGSTVTGGGAAGDRDAFKITGLNAGAQQISFDFSLPDSAVASTDGSTYGAGLQVIYRYEPFEDWGWDWVENKKLRLDYGATQWGSWGEFAKTLTFDLDENFGGTLFLGFAFDGDSKYLQYTFDAGTLPPVPLPAGLALMGSGLALLGGGAAVRRRKARG